jgi:hypothetical protein
MAARRRRRTWGDLTDASRVTGTWEPISVLGEEPDAGRYTADVTLASYGDTWAFVAGGGCNSHRGYLDVDHPGHVSVQVLGLDGDRAFCRGGDPQCPNVTALSVTGRIQLADDGTLYLYDGDEMLASYHLIHHP